MFQEASDLFSRLFSFMSKHVDFAELIRLLETENHECRTCGFTGVDVYRLIDRSAYLKIGETGKATDLARESRVLEWLSGKLSVPQVLGYASDETREALLISEIPGESVAEMMANPEFTESAAENIIRESARALRVVHEIDAEGCLFDMRLAERFRRAYRNITENLISEPEDEFIHAHAGRTPIEVYRDLAACRPPDEELVFTHGDPCFPNILFANGKLSGFIDFDGGGIADRYVDIAIFFQTIKYNCIFDIDSEKAFCEGYGIKELNADKLAFYKLIDDFF